MGLDVSPEDKTHLQWMLKKDQLAQDMFLIGPPSPYRRWLAMKFCELTEQEVEFVQLSRDTTESDLKQRREIAGGDVLFVDQAPVRAAREGRCLVLDGVEKIERNVLPTINNLLENREMHLDSGEFMISAQRYDALEEGGEDVSGLVRVHPDFRVVALGLPVPQFPGNSLDPPLRSRFQSRVVLPPSAPQLLQEVLLAAPGVPVPLAKRLVTFVQGMLMAANQKRDSGNMGPSVPRFPVNAVRTIARIMAAFPRENLVRVMARSYPAMGRKPAPGIDARVISVVRRAVETFGLGGLEDTTYGAFGEKTFNAERGTVSIDFGDSHGPVEAQAGLALKSLAGDEHDAANSVVELPLHQEAMCSMFQDHAAGADILLMGSKGSGKSVLSRHFARHLGYVPVLFSLFKDQTARDLLQRRATDEKGNTSWEPSPVVEAAIKGHVVILDGLDRLSGDTLAVLQRLIVDREVELFDGTRLVSDDVVDMEGGHEKARNVFKVHPSFRIIALACPPSDSNPWFTDEVMSWFRTTVLPELDSQTTVQLIDALFPNAPKNLVKKLMAFSTVLSGVPVSDGTAAAPADTTSFPSSLGGFYSRTGHATKKRKDGHGTAKGKAAELRRAGNTGLSELSLRQILRLCRKMDAFPERAEALLGEHLKSMLMVPYLPQAKQEIVKMAMMQADIAPFDDGFSSFSSPPLEIVLSSKGDAVSIGDVSLPVNVHVNNPEMVPDPLFFEIPSHTLALQGMMRDLFGREQHLLLLGPQGCGKNKLADRLCNMLQREREYVQLHRDSTVGTLTLAPSLRDGHLVWDDSPLVRAVTNGHILMVDEADKAPVEVTSVLKSLIEDREMLLADGRRIVDKSVADEYRSIAGGAGANQFIEIHDDFSMIVLANRPGFPFLGNHFFRDIGDLFAPHTIDNPDEGSEAELLRAYGPSVREGVITALAAAFADLRREVVSGKITYPYSTREAVAIIRHMEQFGEDGVSSALEDVLGFDAFDPVLRRQLCQIFRRHGIPVAEDPLGQDEPVQLSVRIAQDVDIPAAKKVGTIKIVDPHRT
jgi:MoxR-like ATPase